MLKDDDIESVRASEERRGKRRVDPDEVKRLRVLRRKFLEAINSGNEKQFIEMLIHDLGQLPGSPEYIRSLELWRGRSSME